ncbi:MAG: class I tRNA ligase family protein [Oscillospiraceae bacterium]|nr:class I tRNA ligase family protein [Oscillospiraceae bacterium]
MTREEKMNARPVFPERAVITGGMPYGNKELHFGHIGGVFVHADTFARFLRDRIGRENVIFVSGTDCYGSPITEQYRKLLESGGFDGSLQEFVERNHGLQRAALNDYLVDIDLFAGSSIGRAAEIHREMSAHFIDTLYKNGFLEKLTTSQFYDAERGVFLNGRQVSGHCPIAGCKSDAGYADECDLGHQYRPEDLIAPKSALTGAAPEMRDVTNWYLKLGGFQKPLSEWIAEFKERPCSRAAAVSSIEEFLEPPVIYLKREYLGALASLPLPPYNLRDDGKSTSVTLAFGELSGRETACAALSAAGIRYRTGKTLVPFRLTGNIEWGVPAPDLEGLDGLTVWVWPESLWAPISFTQTLLESRGDTDPGAWKRWWCGGGARVYQFIGQDNLYFYGPAQAAMFMGMQGREPSAAPGAGQLVMSDLIVNHHMLFLGRKASSSSAVKPPMARELLEYYTPEQLRAHFLGLGLSLRSVGIHPKPLNPEAKPGDSDPVLKEGGLFTNVLNRVARSCFYTAQKYTDGRLPDAEPSPEAVETAAEAALDYEALMSRCEFHQMMNLLDGYIRGINKHWSNRMKEADAAGARGDGCNAARMQTLADCLHMTRVAAVLAHPIAPRGTELLAEYLNMPDNFFDWAHIFEPISFFVADPGAHRLKFLEPRFDFFPKHESQFERQ